MDKRCEQCYYHIVEDCPGEATTDDDLDCFYSIEDMNDADQNIEPTQ